MGVSSLPKTVSRQRRDCDLNSGPSAPESSTLTTRLPSHPMSSVLLYFTACDVFYSEVSCNKLGDRRSLAADTRMWNDLPPGLRRAGLTFDSSRHSLKSHLFGD